MQALLKYLKGDRTIWIVVLFLSIISMLAVYSSTSMMAMRKQDGNTEYYVIRQLSFLGFGFVLMYLLHRIKHSYFSRISQLLLIIAIPLLLLTLIMGVDINEARRWLKVLGFSFQTSDLAKLALIMYTARVLSKKQHVIKEFDKAFVPVVVPMLVVCALIVPEDLSTTALLFVTCLILMFIGRIRLRHIGLTMWLGITVFLIYIAFASLRTGGGDRIGTWKSRVACFFKDCEESQQVIQAKIAIVKGGLVRVAPGKSEQRSFIPLPYSDYIYAIIMEEYGLLGGLIVIVLYMVLLYRAILIFTKSPGAFGALLAVGLAISLVIQALMNMAVTVNLLPVTGLTLPLVSMGGTSVLFTSVAIGIILSVSEDIETKQNMQIA